MGSPPLFSLRAGGDPGGPGAPEHLPSLRPGLEIPLESRSQALFQGFGAYKTRSAMLQLVLEGGFCGLKKGGQFGVQHGAAICGCNGNHLHFPMQLGIHIPFEKLAIPCHPPEPPNGGSTGSVFSVFGAPSPREKPASRLGTCIEAPGRFRPQRGGLSRSRINQAGPGDLSLPAEKRRLLDASNGVRRPVYVVWRYLQPGDPNGSSW